MRRSRRPSSCCSCATPAIPRSRCPIRDDARGLERADLFTIVFDQVLTDTAQYADIAASHDLPRALRLREVVWTNHTTACQARHRSCRRVAPNAEVFADLIRLLNLEREGIRRKLEAMLRVLETIPAPHGDELRDHWKATAPFGGRPVQFVDVMPRTADQKVHLFPEHLHASAPQGLYRFQPDPATDDFPWR